MKRIVLALLMLTGTYTGAQIIEKDAPRQLNVSGEGKISVTPDEAVITIGVSNIGADAAEVKRENDNTVDKIIKYLKKIKLPEKDYQTQRVYLNRNYDYDKKKYSFAASQTIVITLRDLSKYDDMIIGLTDAGTNKIEGIQFKTSKQAQYESEARLKAVADAQKKAAEYAKATDLYLGYPLVITDNTQTNYPRPMYATMRVESMSDSRETLAIGEIEVTANVNIIFELSYYDIKNKVKEMRNSMND